MGRPRPGCSHHLARKDFVALRDLCPHGFVRDAQRRLTASGHLDRDHPAPRHGPRERDPARGGGPHRGTRPRGEVDTPMAPRVRTGGRLPSAYHRRPAGEGPGAVALRCGCRGCPGAGPSRQHGRRHGQQSGQHGQQDRRQDGAEPAYGRFRSAVHGGTISRWAVPRGSWPGSVDSRRVVDIAVTRHSTGPVHFFWRSGSPGRLRTPRHLPLFGGVRAPRSLVARRVGASGATANLRSR